MTLRKAVWIAALLSIVSVGATTALCQDAAREDPSQAFYTANHYYQQQDYIKAVEEYLKILDMGFENGNLYYNIGNGFLKLGKVGHAILCYEKARRLIPHDSDLKSNIEYARSLVDESAQEEPHRGIVLRFLLHIYEDYSLSALSIMALSAYLALVLVIAVFIVNPIAGRRFAFAAWLLGAYFLINAAVFGLRYYGQVAVRHGVIVQKAAEAKYEPIDNSTTYYTLKEGSIVRVLKTNGEWRQIRRSDGKIGWIRKAAAEEV